MNYDEVNTITHKKKHLFLKPFLFLQKMAVFCILNYTVEID